MASEPATASNDGRASWAVIDSKPSDDQNWTERISAWWAEFSLQTKLLAVATLVMWRVARSGARLKGSS